MQKWEYKVINSSPYEPSLNELGAQGWELVSVATISAPMGGRDEWTMVLKRPKQK